MSRSGIALVALALGGVMAVIAFVTFSGGFEAPAPGGTGTGKAARVQPGEAPEARPVPPPRTPAAAPPGRPAAPPRTEGPAIVLVRILTADGEPAGGAAALTLPAGMEEAEIAQSPDREVVGLWSADGEGNVRLTAVAADLDLMLSARDHLPRRVEVRGLRAAEVRDLGDVSLEAGLAVAGRVVDTAGEPAAEATVRVIADRPEAAWRALVADTDERGEFRIGGLAAGEVGLTVEGVGYVLEGGPRRVRPPAVDVRLVVRRLRVATGRVVAEGEEGLGIGGATVRIDAAWPNRVGQARITQSLPDGRFAVDLSEEEFADPEARFAVKAAAEGFEEGVREGLSLADLLPGQKFELPLRRGVPEPPGSLRGRVLYDTGQAFTGVITLSFHRQGRAGQIRRVTTDETGAYAVDGILPGEYALRSALRDRHDLSETGRTVLVPSGGEAEADLVVPRGGDVAVSVTTAAGEPAKGARVEVLDEQGAAKLTYEAPEGGVRIYDLPSGMASLRISAPGLLAQVVEAPVARDQETPVAVRLEEDR